jgi:hypothetical protein
MVIPQVTVYTSAASYIHNVLISSFVGGLPIFRMYVVVWEVWTFYYHIGGGCGCGCGGGGGGGGGGDSGGGGGGGKINCFSPIFI